MNSNMGLFDEDRNLCFEDMEWNVESMFSTGSPSDSDFDLTKATQDFLEGAGPLHSSSGMIPPSASIQSPNNDHISPRGIADNAEQEMSYNRVKENTANPKQELLNTPAIVEKDCGNSPQHSSLSQENSSVPELNKEAAAIRNDSPEIPSKEASPQYNRLVSVDLAESPIQAQEHVGRDNGCNSQQQNDLPQVPSIGEHLDTALRTEIAFPENGDANEFPGTGYGESNLTNDPIESLIHLPDHVQFNGDLDPILDIQSMGTAAKDDNTTQEMLQVPAQVQHRELMTTPIHATHQIDLSSNLVISNYELSQTNPAGSELDQRPNEITSVPDSQSFLQVHTGIPEQNNIMSSPSIHLDNQTIEEVVQAYQSNVHPLFQSHIASDYGLYRQDFETWGANSHVPLSAQPLSIQRYSSSAGSTPGLPLRPTERIVKKRGRKKSVRDPTKPPLTPRRRKANTPRGNNGEHVNALSPHFFASGTFQRNYSGASIARYSTASLALGPTVPFEARTTERPATPAISGVPFSTEGEIQPSSSSARPKDATPTIAKAPGAVGSGRIAKKPAKKGGRINPETAHLSVEERRSLRAKRNRESAEKSRVRRKVQTAELEMSVLGLRNENKSLKTEVLQFQAQLSRTSMEITQHAESPAEQEQVLRQDTPALLHALMVLQRVINECPRTFRPHPHSPEIQLKIRR